MLWLSSLVFGEGMVGSSACRPYGSDEGVVGEEARESLVLTSAGLRRMGGVDTTRYHGLPVTSQLPSRKLCAAQADCGRLGD